MLSGFCDEIAANHMIDLDGQSTMDGFTRIANQDLIPEESEIIIIQPGMEDCRPLNERDDPSQARFYRQRIGDHTPCPFFLFSLEDFLSGLERMMVHLEARHEDARVYVLPTMRLYGKALRLSKIINDELVIWSESARYRTLGFKEVDMSVTEDYMDDIFTSKPNGLWDSIMSDSLGKYEGFGN